MSTDVITSQVALPEAIEALLIRGDLSQLTPIDRVSYYKKVCDLVGLNYTTQPFEYLMLNGKLVLYAKKGAAEQIRDNKKISIRITDRQTIEGVYVVTAAGQTPDGRIDESTGAVPIAGLKGDALANAMMKAETKAKRRVTLSMSGLNILDESEVKDIPPGRVGPGQWELGNASAANKGANFIESGSYVGRHVSELSPDELRNKKRILEAKLPVGGKPALTIEEQQTLEQINDMIATIENAEPEFEEPKGEEIRCTCGSELKLSERKGVYYCANFKAEGQHIRSIPKDEYLSRTARSA